MAFGVTTRAGTSSSYSTASTISSFTPAADTLLIAIGFHRSTSDPTVTGHGTWTKLVSETASSRGVWAYGLLVGGSPSASSVTMTWGTNTQVDGLVMEISGADVSGTINDAVLQAVGANQYNGGGGPFTNSVTLSAFASSTNMAIAAGNVATGGEAGYTTANIGTYLGAFYKASEDTTPSYQSTSNFSRQIVLGLEVAEDAGGGTTVVDQDFASSWNISEAIDQSYISSWRIVNSVDDSFSSSWDIKSEVLDSFGSSWLIKESIDDSFASSWGIYEEITLAGTTAWNIFEEVSRSQATSWQILNAGVVNQSFSSEWLISEEIAIQQESSWRLLNAVDDSFSSVWQIKNEVAQNYSSSWLISELIELNITCSWVINGEQPPIPTSKKNRVTITVKQGRASVILKKTHISFR